MNFLKATTEQEMEAKILDMIYHDPSVEVRAQAVKHLIGLGDDEALYQVVITTPTDWSVNLRERALRGIDNEEYLEKIVTKKPKIESWLIKIAISLIVDIPMLERLAKNEDEFVSKEAKYRAFELGWWA
jgi:hypothetical protein